MATPGFTAEVTLDRSGRSYRTQRYGGPAAVDVVQPQKVCFCAEPDTVTVCKGTGAKRVCTEKEVCLQEFCFPEPGLPNEITGTVVYGSPGTTGSHIGWR